MITVIKRDGRTETLDITKIQKHTTHAVKGLEGVSQSELEVDSQIQFRDMMETKDIQQTLIKTAVDKIDIDVPNWTFVAARLFLYDLYHTVTKTAGYNHLKEYIDNGIKEGKLFKKLAHGYDVEDLNNYIKPERDLQFTYLGIKTLGDRYLTKDTKGNIIELPQQLFMGVAMFLAQNEENKQEWAKKFYDILSRFEVMAGTPTISNGRTTRNQLSSCYIGSTPDNIEGIFDAYKEVGLYSKFGGGVGEDWSNIRSGGSTIDDNPGVSAGPMPFLKILNSTAIACDQLGIRRGSIAPYLETWHMDIRDFVVAKQNSGEERLRLHDLFPAVWTNDLFMKRVNKNDKWTLFDPYDVSDLTSLYGKEFEKRYIEYEEDSSIRRETIMAKDLWKLILRNLFDSGSPFITFKDNANKANPNKHDGVIRSSNLCVTGETKILTKSLGYVPIKDVAGKELECWNGEEWSLTELYKTSAGQEVMSVSLSTGQLIEATPYHKWLIKVNENDTIIKTTEELEEGDVLLDFDLKTIPHGNLELTFPYERGRDKTATFGGNERIIPPDRKWRLEDRVAWFSGFVDGYCSHDDGKLTYKGTNEEVIDLKLALQEMGIRSESIKNNLCIKSNGINALLDLGLVSSVHDLKVVMYNSIPNETVTVVKVSATGKIVPTYCGTEPKKHRLMFNGVLTMNCTEIFQNTSPDKYKIKAWVRNGDDYILFDEDEEVLLEDGSTVPAKKLSSIYTLAIGRYIKQISGKICSTKYSATIFNIEKERVDGETAVCNLASVNLSRINTKEDIERVVPIAVRMLDNVIDLNFFPTNKSKYTNIKNRAIGLGVMGEAEYLATNQIHWGSDKHLYEIDRIMEEISYNVINSSADLANEKGNYPAFDGSEWSKGILPIDKANKHTKLLIQRLESYNWDALREKAKEGVRNGYMMAIAPTSSISIITGTTQTIEPVYKRKWFEENMSGLIPVVVPKLSSDTWEYYTPAYDINQNALIMAAAIRQKWMDQGQSLNIFIKLDKASGKYLNEIYMNAWKYGLKSTYYLRSQSPETETDVEDRSQECVGCQ